MVEVVVANKDEHIGSAVVELDAIVPEQFSGDRVDRAVAKLFTEHAAQTGASRTEIARWLRDGAMTVDGRVVKPKTLLRGGERIRVRAVRELRFDWQSAEELKFRILYEDASLIVVDKPAGLVVHPGAGNPRGTLVNGLLHHRPQLATLPRAGLVHRLDKDTSGLLVVAAEPASRAALVEAMGARRIERRCAVVEGQMVVGRSIDSNIGRVAQPLAAEGPCGRSTRGHPCDRARAVGRPHASGSAAGNGSRIRSGCIWRVLDTLWSGTAAMGLGV